jgi:hypothetical protein
MADDKETPAPAKSAPAKKAPVKKPAPKADSFVVAPGKSLTAGGRVFGPGEVVTADVVADLEALIKGGFVLKA